MDIDLDTVVGRGGNHVETEMGGQTVMMSIAQGEYYALQATGQRIWQLLAAPMSPRALARAMSAEYEVRPETAQAEVLAFVRTMAERGLVEPVAA